MASVCQGQRSEHGESCFTGGQGDSHLENFEGGERGTGKDHAVECESKTGESRETRQASCRRWV